MKCNECNGTGLLGIPLDEYSKYTPYPRCEKCGGTGEVEQKVSNPSKRRFNRIVNRLEELRVKSNDIEFLKEQNEKIKKMKQVITDTRKFMNRLPSEWFPERICGLLDDCLKGGDRRC